jgi:molybdopterin-binding protein
MTTTPIIINLPKNGTSPAKTIELQLDIEGKIEAHYQTPKFKQYVEKLCKDLSPQSSSPKTIEIQVDFDKKIKDQLGSRETKEMITNICRNVSSTDDYWTYLLKQVQIQNAIQVKVNEVVPGQVQTEIRAQLTAAIMNKLTSILPDQVQKHLKSYAPEIIEREAQIIVAKIASNHMKDYIRDSLPDKVKDQIETQFAQFFNTNHKMNQILSEHSKKLNEDLSGTVRSILHELVRDPQYHQITIEHLSALNKSFETEMQNLHKLNLEQLENQKTNFEVTLQCCASNFQSGFQNLAKSVTDELKTVQNANIQMVQLEKNKADKSVYDAKFENTKREFETRISQMQGLMDTKFKNQETKNKEMQDQTNNWKWSTIGLIVINVVIGAAWYYSPNIASQSLQNVDKYVIKF